ncbi:SPARC-like protein 1 isoform X5 [Engystomops pustulosus]|uniref:SPARC-like protein 1 isoform X5 n=1 Tax=Engystomops pustulosus TaxID=76066 RepID=UPI003AFA8A52
MYSFLVACLFGIFFMSPSVSITVDNGLNPGLKLNESTMEQKHILTDGTDRYVVTDDGPNMESNIHSINNMGFGEQPKVSKTKPGPFSLEYFLNMFNVHVDDNGPPSLTNISKNLDEEYGDSRQDKVHITTEKAHHSDSLEGNTGYANILNNIYNDEDLQYILDISHNLSDIGQSRNNETHDHVEEPSPEDLIDIKENAANIKEEYVDENDENTSRNDRITKEEILMKEVYGDRTRFSFGDLEIKQAESVTEGPWNQQNSIVYNNRGDVADVGQSTEMSSTDQSNQNVKNATAFLAKHLGNSNDNHVSYHGHDVDASGEKEKESLEINNTNLSTDSCINFHCKRGKTCKTDGQGYPFCACQDPNFCLPSNKNDLVCGTDNKTYTSACQLFAKKCLLEGTKEGNHLHLDYQGPCKFIPPCTEYELAHFPFRMRDWLKNVLMQLYERDQENTTFLSEKQKSKVKKIYENERRLQEEECNTNNDRRISLREWCRCFGIKDGDIDEDLLF